MKIEVQIEKEISNDSDLPYIAKIDELAIIVHGKSLSECFREIAVSLDVQEKIKNNFKK